MGCTTSNTYNQCFTGVQEWGVQRPIHTHNVSQAPKNGVYNVQYIHTMFHRRPRMGCTTSNTYTQCFTGVQEWGVQRPIHTHNVSQAPKNGVYNVQYIHTMFHRRPRMGCTTSNTYTQCFTGASNIAVLHHVVK